MINVALLSVIRRWHYREGLSIREISRRTTLSRNTIAKYLHSEVNEPKYLRRRMPKNLDEFASELSGWLNDNLHQGRKRRKSCRQMYQLLRENGYTGSYGRVAAFARHWRQMRQDQEGKASHRTFVPLQFSPGEAFQFDWSEETVMLAGTPTQLQIAHFKLSYSRVFLLRAYPTQAHEMLFDAHNMAFAVFGGVPERGIYDNMKTAVDKVRSGKARDINTRFLAMTGHYLFEPQFCSPAAGWEKGQVEKSIRDARHRIWSSAPDFPHLEALNAWLHQRCLALWKEILHPEHSHRTLAELWLEEKATLMPFSHPFDGFVETFKRVSPTCLIHLERRRYSVPASLANRPVSVRLYAERVEIAAEGQIVATHPRPFDRHSRSVVTIYDWRHYLSVVQRKPGALRNGAPFAELPEGFKQLQQILLKRPGGDREMVDILSLVLHHDEEAVLTAVELAIEAGVPSKAHVINFLRRLLDDAPPAPAETPEGLLLRVEPQANVARYDRLRGHHDAA